MPSPDGDLEHAAAGGEHEPRDPFDDDNYHEDPDAPATEEGRRTQAIVNMQALLLAAMKTTAVLLALIVTIEAMRGHGYTTSKGFLLGAVLATTNLWLLASGILQLTQERANLLRGTLALLGSFALLLVCGGWVIFFARAWTLGFALGIASPAVAGLVYAKNAP